MRKRILHISCALLAWSQAQSQVEVDHSIMFISSDSTKRQIYQSGYPHALDGASRTDDARYNRFNYPYVSPTMNNDTVYIQLDPAPSQLDSLFYVEFQVPQTVNAELFLKVNQWPAYRVTRVAGDSLKWYESDSGSVLQVFYTDSTYRLLHARKDGCPNGFVVVNENYCIEIDERPAHYFWNANRNCESIRARLCTWGEWYYACQKTGLGLVNMTTNYEFIDDGSDHISNVALVGSGNCTNMADITTVILTSSYKRNYRCCFSR